VVKEAFDARSAAHGRPPEKNREHEAKTYLQPTLANRVKPLGGAKIRNVGEKVGVWKGIGCGLIAAGGGERCPWFQLRSTEAGQLA
jgi:hypothetical protein